MILFQSQFQVLFQYQFMQFSNSQKSQLCLMLFVVDFMDLLGTYKLPESLCKLLETLKVGKTLKRK